LDYAKWAPRYVAIAKDLGYEFARERRSADRLRALLPEAALRRPSERTIARIQGCEAVVVGLGPEAGAPPMHLLPPTPRSRVVLAADGAAARCLAAGLVPDLVVTDLDGPVASEVTANVRGALVVVHAHGDNVPALERWVPEFSGDLVGSWAGPPKDGLIDVGGFTDGDRAAYLAEDAGASAVLLWGFDFERPEDPPGPARERKLRKLAFAKDALGFLATQSPVPILEWRLDGSRRLFAP
jgi:uncharacterized Rossmann fold enzyme